MNEHPSEATVVWNSQGLKIDASNSSLGQILKDVATATGARVQGLGQDQRIFGSYGPGPARDVLTQLLAGSGYNVLMVGDQGQGTPRQIVLSIRPQANGRRLSCKRREPATTDENRDADEQREPPQPRLKVRPGFAPGRRPAPAADYAGDAAAPTAAE